MSLSSSVRRNWDNRSAHYFVLKKKSASVLWTQDLPLLKMKTFPNKIFFKFKINKDIIKICRRLNLIQPLISKWVNFSFTCYVRKTNWDQTYQILRIIIECRDVSIILLRIAVTKDNLIKTHWFNFITETLKTSKLKFQENCKKLMEKNWSRRK